MTDQPLDVYHEGRSTIQDKPQVIEERKAKLRALFERAAKAVLRDTQGGR